MHDRCDGRGPLVRTLRGAEPTLGSIKPVEQPGMGSALHVQFPHQNR